MPSVTDLLTKVLLLALVVLVLGNGNVASGIDEQECVVQEDGSCLSSISPSDGADVEIPPLPPVNATGYLDTGFGEPQQIAGTQKDQTMERMQKMYEYMHREVLHDPKFQSVASECLLRNEQCAYWAAIGECEANPPYMVLQCAPACFTCEKLAFETRCPLTELPPNIWEPGDLDRMFEGIVTDEYYKTNYNPQVILKPGMEAGAQDAPWVVIVDDFLSEEECDTLIRLGADRGYERSMDVGQKKFDGTYESHLSQGRTSANAWCLEKCYEDEVTQGVLRKIENLTAIPDSHSEYLQLLKYEETQFYEQHHDYIEYHLDRAQGVRIVTVFLYLNDVEEGGGTRFPKLELVREQSGMGTARVSD